MNVLSPNGQVRCRPGLAALAAVLLVAGLTEVGGASRAAAGSGPSAPAARCPSPLTATGHLSPAGGVPFTICSGRVPSFDGTPLDVDLSLPDSPGGPRPLMTMLHGWGSSKSDFESASLDGNGANTFHWNNAWFAGQGYAVLNYTARGFHRSCGQDQATGYTYVTDPACAGKASWTHLADRRWEIHDTQYLAGVLVDDHVADARAIAVTGDSYGGGQSWLLALAQGRVLLPDGRTTAWTSPQGTPLRLAAAVPQYPWTDLGQALLDNGRASDGFFGAPADGPHEAPLGVPKLSYLAGLYTLGATTAQYAAPGADATADLPGWNAAILAGEPYDQNPIAAAALTQIEQFRSPFSLPVPPAATQVPVFDLQGTTDPLFPAIQALQMANKLTAAAPNYPLRTFLGDIGHSYAANPHQVWVAANTAANAFLRAAVSGAALTQPRFTADTTACGAGQSIVEHAADSVPALASGTLDFAAADTQSTSSAIPAGPEAARTDPLTGGLLPGQPASGGCPTMTTQTDPGVAAWRFTPPATGTLVGSPVVHVDAQLTGTDAELAARLWDIDPATGTQALVSRSVSRLTSATATSGRSLAFELWPVAWQLLPGHQVKLELTQTDNPTWRPDNLASSLQLSGLRLTLPYHS